MQLTKTRKQVIYLFFSTILGTFLGLLVSILNTRCLDPIEYGDVRYVNNLMSLFSGILLFGYFVSGSRLLAVAKDTEEARRIKGLLVFILGITYLVMILAMVLCGLFHCYLFDKNFYNLFYLSIPVCGSYLMLNYINTSSQGDNSIFMIAVARVLPQCVYLLAAFFVYKYWGATSERMILLQNGLSSLVLLFLILKNSPKFSNIKETFRKLNKENKRYGLQVYWGSLSGVSVQYLAGFSLGLFNGDNSDVAFYTLALTVTSPLAMLPNVIGTTYFKQFAHLQSIPKRVMLSTYTMSILSLIGFILLIYPIVDLLYNESYSSVASYACILALGFSLHGLGDVYNRFLGAHGQGSYLRNAAFISGGISFVGYTLGIYYGGINAALVTRVISAAAYFFVLLFGYKVFCKK